MHVASSPVLLLSQWWFLCNFNVKNTYSNQEFTFLKIIHAFKQQQLHSIDKRTLFIIFMFVELCNQMPTPLHDFCIFVLLLFMQNIIMLITLECIILCLFCCINYNAFVANFKVLLMSHNLIAIIFNLKLTKFTNWTSSFQDVSKNISN